MSASFKRSFNFYHINSFDAFNSAACRQSSVSHFGAKNKMWSKRKKRKNSIISRICKQRSPSYLADVISLTSLRFYRIIISSCLPQETDHIGSDFFFSIAVKSIGFALNLILLTVARLIFPKSYRIRNIF